MQNSSTKYEHTLTTGSLMRRMYRDHGRRDSLWDPLAHGLLRIFLVCVSWPGTGAGDQETGTWSPFTECPWARYSCQLRVDRAGSSPARLLGCAGLVPDSGIHVELHCRHPAGSVSASPSTEASPTESCPSYSSRCHDTLCTWRKYFLSSTIAAVKKTSISKTNKNMGMLKKISRLRDFPSGPVGKTPRSQ